MERRRRWPEREAAWSADIWDAVAASTGGLTGVPSDRQAGHAGAMEGRLICGEVPQ